MQKEMKQYSEFIAKSAKKKGVQNIMLFENHSDDEEESSDDDLKRKSVLEGDIEMKDPSKPGSIKKGVDPDVGEYQIDLH